MTLTEEQREAIRAVSDLPRAIGCTQCHSYIQEHYGNQFAILRAMIDSGEHFTDASKMPGFDLERARGLRDFLQDDCAEVGDVWGEMIAEIERLRPFEIAARYLDSDLTKIAGERDDQAARIKELESSLDEAETLTKQNAELMNGYLRRIAELEDALVEGLTNFLHYRASCYDPARRCPYAKECDDCSTWDACGHVEMFRSEARRQLQAEGKIGPDAAKPQSWQITEERKAALWHAIKVLKENDIMEEPEEHLWDEEVTVLQAMLTEAGL